MGLCVRMRMHVPATPVKTAACVYPREISPFRVIAPRDTPAVCAKPKSTNARRTRARTEARVLQPSRRGGVRVWMDSAEIGVKRITMNVRVTRA